MKAVAVEAMRALDARTIAAGTTGFVLMERAGREAYAALCHILSRPAAGPARPQFTVLAGKGNNGGDAYVVARCLAEAGEAVAVYAVCAPSDLSGEALAHASRLPASVPVTVAAELPACCLTPGHVIVDGLLGTGFAGAPRPPYERWIAQANASGCPIVSLDLPSGLDGDTGQAPGAVIDADWTITIGLPKSGLLTADGLRHCGSLRCVDIGFPADFVAAVPSAGPDAFMMADARALVARRPRDSHKGSFGHVLIIGGSVWYAGAPFLAALGAARSGAGLVTVAIPAGCEPLCAVPASLIVRRVRGDGAGFLGRAAAVDLRSLAEGRHALILGPGMGPAAQGHEVLAEVIHCGLPLVVDADALRHLAACPALTLEAQAAMVLTPHPGEMAALLAGYGGAGLAPGASRVEQALALARTCQAVVVLKGMGTVVAAPDGRAAVNTSGSPALATAGTGDVLAGMVGALLAQGLPAWDAARLAVFVHGLAAELFPAAERALLADDLADLIGSAWREVSPRA